MVMTSLIWIFFFKWPFSFSHMLRLLQDSFIFGEGISSHFFRVTISIQQFISRSMLFLQSNCFFFRSSFFGLVTYLLQSFFQNSYFFRAKFLPCKRFLRIESFLGQLTAILLAEDFIRINISTEILLFRNRYLCIALTFSEKQKFGKS